MRRILNRLSNPQRFLALLAFSTPALLCIGGWLYGSPVAVAAGGLALSGMFAWLSTTLLRGVDLLLGRLEADRAYAREAARASTAAHTAAQTALHDAVAVVRERADRAFEATSSLDRRLDAIEQSMRIQSGQVVSGFATQAGVLSALQDAVQDPIVAVRTDANRVLGAMEEIRRLIAHQASDGERALESMDRRNEALERLLAASNSGVENVSREIIRLGEASREIAVTNYQQVIQELDALLQIYGIVGAKRFSPVMGDWAMDPVGLRSLLEVIERRKPTLILELGSGASTIWIARLLKLIGHGALVSVDHLEHFATVTRRALDANDLSDVADVRLTPLMDVQRGGEVWPWYSSPPASWLDGRNVDMLLVDGPPGRLRTQARYPAMFMLEPHLADEAIVVLDDFNRPDEEAMLKRWLREYNGLGERSVLGRRTLALTYLKVPNREQ